jgi:hypothetical protein
MESRIAYPGDLGNIGKLLSRVPQIWKGDAIFGR